MSSTFILLIGIVGGLPLASGIDPVIGAALIGAGATLLSSSGGSGGASTWQLNGNVIIESQCWIDGSGPCPNGNCLDNKGRRGIVLKETTVSCKWYCFHRGHCKTQICCPFSGKPQNAPVGTSDWMGPGTRLNSGEKLVSKNGLYTVIMQTDGNLVLYKWKKHPLWSTGTHGATRGFTFRFQKDGNLVLYDMGGRRVRWASHTYGKRDANKLIMQNDGNLVLYTKTNGVLWASHTYQG